MKNLFACLAFLLLTVTAGAWGGDKPNVIVIFSDDHGWADLGCQGVQKDIRTPNLDGLAAGGLRAVCGYVSAPQCVPSRAGMLTGRYQPRFGVESNGSTLDGFNAQQTIASRLKAAGYATGMAGKWHLGPPQEITRHGFDDVFYSQGAGSVWANFDLDGKTVPGGSVKCDRYHLEADAAAACAFIKRHRDQPFFFYLAYRAPHTPLDATKKYTARFPGEMPERRRQALAMISAMDDGVGEVLKTLREYNLEEKTLIFFMGDNGAPLKIHKIDAPLNGDAGGWDGSLNEPMNGEKGMLSEGGMRTPWLAYWKGRIPAGQVYPHPVISLDVAATAVALAGLPHDPALDGVNLMPFFSGENKAPPHEVLFWRWEAQAAIREGKWKLLVGGTRQYLYDLDADAEEKHSLFAQHPEVAKRLRSRLEAWAGELQPPGLGLRPMAQTWEEYFDYYLEGKPAPAPTAELAEVGKEKAQGWTARNCTAEMQDGALQIRPEKAGKPHPFLAFAKLSIQGPVGATISLRNGKGGSVGLAWRLSGQGDFPPEQVASVDAPANADWQDVKLSLPATGEIIHLRILLPDGETALRRIAIAGANGKPVKEWSFK